MMALGLIGGIMSGVMGMMSAQAQADAQADAAEQNARIAEYNRQVAERNKNTALAEADAEARDVARDNRRQLASIRAAYGASGLSLEGSPLDVMTDTALEQELDVNKTRYKGQLRAIGYQDEANNYAMKRDLYKSEASHARSSGGIAGAAALFGGLAGAVKGAGGAGFSMMGA